MASILIIDDEAGIRALLRATLKAAGYEVAATNGRQGLDLYRHAMPDLNGLDMILALTRQFLHAKVIAISGMDGDANVLDVAKLLGARRTFHKPLSMTTLPDAVRYELAHQRPSLFLHPRRPSPSFRSGADQSLRYPFPMSNASQGLH